MINSTFKIIFCALMLSLTLIFQYLEQFMPFLGLQIMNINLSIIFVLPVIFVSGYLWAILILILRFAIGPGMHLGYSIYNIWGHFILLFSGLLFLHLLILFKFIFQRIKINNDLKWIFIIIITIFLSTIFLTILNGIFFTPIYLKLYGAIEKYNFIWLNDHWVTSGIYILYLHIPSYWGAIFAIYIPANLIKFIVCGALFFPLLKVMKIKLKINELKISIL